VSKVIFCHSALVGLYIHHALRDWLNKLATLGHLSYKEEKPKLFMTCLFLDNFDYINRVDDVNEKLSGPKQSIKITNVLNPMSAIAYLDYFQKVLRW